MRVLLLLPLVGAGLASAADLEGYNFNATNPSCNSALENHPVTCSASIATNSTSDLSTLCTHNCLTTISLLTGLLKTGESAPNCSSTHFSPPLSLDPSWITTAYWSRCTRDVSTGELCGLRPYNASTDRWPSVELQRTDQLSETEAKAQNATWCAGASCFVQDEWIKADVTGRDEVVGRVRETCGKDAIGKLPVISGESGDWYDESGWEEKVNNTSEGNGSNSTDVKKADESGTGSFGASVLLSLALASMAIVVGL